MAETFTPIQTSNLTNQTSITTAIDSNFSALSTLLNDVVSRAGNTPNSMSSVLDMNGNSIINLAAPSSSLSPVRQVDLTTNTTISFGGTSSKVGLTAIAGTASTAAHSDSVPALDQTIAPTWTGSHTFSNTVTFSDPVTFGSNITVNDQTTVLGAGSLSKFYNPSFFGNTGTGIVDRFNRVKVGGNSTVTFDVTSATNIATTPEWVDTLFSANLIGSGQLAVTAAWGNPPISTACRSSDYHSAFGGISATGGMGNTFIAYNDSTTGVPTAYGVYNIGVRASGCDGLTFGEIVDTNNLGSLVVVTPHSGDNSGGGTFGTLYLAGSLIGTANVSAAIALGSVTNKYNKGIVFFNGSLDTTQGGGSGGIAIAYYRNMSVRWMNSTDTVDAEMWGNASGLNVNTSVLVNGSILSSASSGGGVGYVTGLGVGATVTQATSKSTGVTINAYSGQITMNNAALASNATAVFTVTNSTVAATDVVHATVVSGEATAGSYLIWTTSMASGSFAIAVRNVSSGSLSEAVVIGYVVVKGTIT